MPPFIPSLFLILLLAGPALLTPTTSHELQVRGHRTPRDTKQDAIKVVISEGCANQGDSSDASQGGKEIDLVPGSPLVLTHKIKLVPSGSGSGSGSCGCEADFAALRERLERLEREVSTLREKCGGAEGGCCTSKESKGAGCSIKPDISECPNECSDQGRCVDGKCVCFPGFSGPDCSESDCPGNCNDKGRCVNGQCVCDPGFTGPDCSEATCPNNCNNRGRCVNGKCVCESGFTGTDCSEKSCPGNCNNKGRCINGQCVCNPGFTGPDCSKRACPDNCNNRGRCVNGKCVCNSGFTGADCSEVACPGNCNNKGRCVNGQCVCNPGFTGPDCSQRSCPDNCNNRGRCVNGKCVCNSGFTGADCSEVACPGNCNNRGRCINGECVCDEGFGGPDCSERICPNDCYDRGKCVDGQCVCDSGFTGDDCSEKSCPGNCNNKGRCVDGQCVCDDGFTGADCSEKSCPNNCSNRGKCVNGKCVCNVGFAGPDCSAKGCPNNCSNKGRCVKGKCVCRRGFTGPDCSQCDEGMTGPNCDIVMSGVTQLNTQDITETSVTLVWTPPAVQYDTYHITFTSQKESDQQITAQVEGSLTTFTQTGLAAGQEYSVTLTGEIDGRRGTETSTEFMTLISGPTNLRVVKTTTTSAVVQWEKSQGEIDRYYLTITPSDGAGRNEEMTVPPDQDSAHIQRLEAGRTYDIILVAEKGSSRSEPATTKAVPGKSIPRVTMASLTRHVTPAPGLDQEFNPSPKVQNQQGRREDERETGSVKPGVNGPNRDSASVIARTKPLVNRKMAINGTKPKLAERPALSGKPKFPGPFRFNTTRVVPGGRKVGHGPLKKPQVGEKKKVPVVLKKPKPGAPKIGNRTIASTVNEPSVEASSTEGRDDKNPAITSGTDSEANRQSSLEEPKEQPDVGVDGQGKDTDPVSSEPSGAFQSQEKKCLNKIKVTHVRLPLTDRGSGCRGDGTVVGTDGAPPSDLKALSAETDVDITQDPLYKLVKDTFHNMNITTFSVHLSKESGLLPDADTKRVLTGLRPLSSFSSSSASSSPSQSSDSTQPPPSSSSQISADQSHSSSPQSSSSSVSLPSPSHVSSSLTEAPSSSLTDLTSSSGGPQLPSLSLTPLSHPSASSSSSDESNSVGNNDLDADNIKSSADTASPEQRLQPNSGKSNVPVYRRTSPKHSFIRRPHSNVDLLKNKTNLNFRVSHRHPLPLDIIPGGETEPRHAPTDQSLSSSASEESSSVEVNTPVRGTSGGKDVEATPAPSEEQNQKKVSSERKRIPIRRPFPNGGYVRRPLPNKGPLQNRTRPNSRIFTRPPQPLRPEIETQKERTHPTSTVFTRPPQPLHPEIETQKERTHPTSTVFTRPPQPLHPERETQKERTHPTSTVFTHPPQPLHPERETQKERTHPTSTVFTHPPQPLHPERETQKERTHPTSTVFTHPPQPLHPEIETQKEPISPTDLPATSSPPVSKESDPAEGTDPVKKDIEDRSRISVSNELNKTQSGSGVPSSKRPNTQAGFFRRTQLYGGPFQNRTRPNLRPPHQPHRHLIRKPHPGRKPNERVSQRQNGSTPGVPEKPSGEQDVPRPTQEVRIREAEEQETEEIIPSGQTDGHGTTTRPEINDLEKENSAPVSTGKDTAPTIRGKPAVKPSSSNLKPSRPVTPPRRQPPKVITTGQNRTQPRKYISGSPKRVEPKTNVTTKTVFESKPPVGSDISSSGVTREPLDYVGVTNKTSDGFTVVWDSPEGKYKNFVVTKKQVRKPERPKQEERKQEERQDVNKKKEPTREPESGSNIEDENRVPERVVTQTPRTQSSTTVTPALESDKTSKEVLPGSARSIRFEDLPPQTEYVITLLGKGPGLLSRLHKLVISTGPEPPTNIIFSELTENSLTVSWTKPKSPVSGFKVTYTHTEEGEPVSVSLDSKESSLSLSQLSPGSTYEVNVISILGLDESDPIKDSAMTLPDPPTDLRAVNVTDTKALLLWRPALAAIDKYAIVYGSGTDSEVRITVSGNAAEQQLSGLKESTTYTVTITSQLGSQQSSPATTTFTTTSGSGKDGDGPHDLQAHDVTPRTALLTWKPPPKPTGSYKLIYVTEGQGRKEVIVDASVTEYNLTKLHPGSKYTVELQVEGGGQHSTISTEFTTGTLRFPFPSDCSQEMLNGIKTSGVAEIYPRGKQGKPLRVYCDMETDGGGWTVFQRRKDGSVNFFRGWKDYIRGFGDLSGEFWLGLDSLHNLTTMTRMSLRVDLQDGPESVYAKYSTFEVANRNYKLTVGGYSGTAGDSLTYHNNRIFSTKDRDLAPFITRCAMSYRGGWWYKNCHEANLNGLYGIDVKHQGVIWTSWKGKEHSIAFTEMKMRPASFSPPVRG